MADKVEETDALKQKDFTTKWLNRINDALKREKGFRTQGRMCVDLYEAKHPERVPFSILYSNTETLVPAIYNATPIPMVDRRFKDADPVGKVASEVSTRILKFEVDAENDSYDSFDEIMQAAVLDVTVTNRGVTRFKYVPHMDEDEVKSECVYGEPVRWDKFFHGYARTWKKVPWIGFEWDMSKDEIEENFGEDMAKKIDFSALDHSTSDDAESGSSENRQDLTGVHLAKVYEIWDKRTKKVMFFCGGHADQPLKVVEDPLKLSGFFPVPKPMNLMKKITSLMPTPLYIQYKEQAEELNAVTRRIKGLIQAAKIRGFYNSTIDGIDKILTSEENTLTPMENMESLGENPNVSNLIWLMPIAEIVSAIQQLYQQREQIKQVIYEITGISDILRGSSVASETATAQNIKNQWGTLRLKKMQKEVQRYCRDALRIILEIAVTRFSQETVAAMTGLNLPTAAMKQQAGMQLQQMQMAAQQQPPQAGPDGQPMPQQPPQIPPELQEMLSTPSWEEVLKVLKDDVVRAYKVDIETNSTIDAEAAQDKQDIAELLNGLSQFLNGIAPLIEKGVLPFEVAKGMLLSICRRYTFGPQLEDAINKMAAPPPQDKPDPNEQMKMQTEQMKLQGEQAKSQTEMARMKQEGELAAAEHQQKMDEMVLKGQLARQQLEIEQERLALERQKLAAQAEFSRSQHIQKMQALSASKPAQAKENA